MIINYREHIPILQYRLHGKFNTCSIFNNKINLNFVGNFDILNNPVNNVLLYQVLHRNYSPELCRLFCASAYLVYYVQF